ncbi:DgyrCDS2242 [Dimorphilus gyrociliatus]|uniref:DgyrCDS2242 n=1 Tax=Dimorphilus gyrociliatus TaxID=2664684 RepID=A0A7I8VCG5_9ANNE|nr:DgyrCDS2242 [Dimorphilus gyrociliatus]
MREQHACAIPNLNEFQGKANEKEITEWFRCKTLATGTGSAPTWRERLDHLYWLAYVYLGRRRHIAMTSVLVRSPNDSVRYSACAKTEDENQEAGCEPVANVSNDDTEDIANGPRTDRTKLIGGSARIGSVPSSSGRNAELKGKSTSRGSLFEIVTNKFNKKQHNRTFSKESVAYINRAHISDQVARKDVRKLRRKEIDEKFGKRARKGGARFDLLDSSTVSSQKNSCNWTFVFDPSGRLAYWWSLIVSMAFIYNFWVMIYRVAFDEIDHSNKAIWFSMDYIADLLYALDIAFHFRTGYLEDGILEFSRQDRKAYQLSKRR